VFGILAGLGEIGIRILQHGILIPVSELLLQANISRNLMILCFHCALPGVLVNLDLSHESTSYNE
jgi:hypothetical protein